MSRTYTELTDDERRMIEEAIDAAGVGYFGERRQKFADLKKRLKEADHIIVVGNGG